MVKSNKQSILIIVIAGIGDLVLASKSIESIRAGFPEADIHLLTSTEAASIARNYNYLNYIWAFPIRELRKSKSYLFDILKLIVNLRKITFASVINLYLVGSWWGALRMGLLFLCLKGNIKVGHGNKGFSLFLTKILPDDTFRNRHLADAMMDIAIAAGGVPDGKGITVFWDRSAEDKWKAFFPKGKHAKTIGINPGGDRKNRRWDPERFAIVADRLIEKFKARIIILGGPAEEEIALNVEGNMKNKPINLAGKLSLNELVYVIECLDLLLTNDSGPMHIGAAVRTPLVALFGPENPSVTGPYTTQNLYRVMYKPIDCRPCEKNECDKPNCLDLITPDDVYEKCVELLSNHIPHM